jgi:hypothetical protein
MMKGTPRSIWLSIAHQAAGFWMGAMGNTLRRQQRAMVGKAIASAVGKSSKQKSRNSPRRRKPKER